MRLHTRKRLPAHQFSTSIPTAGEENCKYRPPSEASTRLAPHHSAPRPLRLLPKDAVKVALPIFTYTEAGREGTVCYSQRPLARNLGRSPIPVLASHQYREITPSPHSTVMPNRVATRTSQPILQSASAASEGFSAEQPFRILGAFTHSHMGVGRASVQSLGVRGQRSHRSSSRRYVHIFSVSPANRTAIGRDRIVVKSQETLAMLI